MGSLAGFVWGLSLVSHVAVDDDNRTVRGIRLITFGLPPTNAAGGSYCKLALLHFSLVLRRRLMC